MATVQVKIASVAPLLMHNGLLADPMYEWTREIKKVTSKRKKTDEDHAEVKRLEYIGGLYWNEDDGPHITSDMIEACVRDGAKVNRLGKQVLSSVFCMAEFIPLQYKGPRDIDSLFADRAFVDTRGVRVNSGRVSRTRPKFKDWSLEFELHFEPTGMSFDELKEALIEAGKKGLGDYRPKYGRFTVETFKTI